MKLKKIFSGALLIIIFCAIGILTVPFGVALVGSIAGQQTLNFADQASVLFGEAPFTNYIGMVTSSFRNGDSVGYAVLWVAIFIAIAAICMAWNVHRAPDRVSKNSPLGNARIIDKPSEIKRCLDFWNGEGVPRSLSLVVSGSDEGYFYNSGIPHWLCVSKTGGGKTQLIVLETLHLAIAKGANLLVTGKSELVELTGDKAEELGYRRVIFDLDGYPGASGFNPIDLVVEYADNGNIDAAQKTARQTAADLISVTPSDSNKYFYSSARSALTSVILIVAYADIPRNQKNMTSVYQIFAQGTTGDDPKDPSLPLKQYIKDLGIDHPAYGPASDFLSDGGQTNAGKNVLSTLKDALNIFGDESTRAICAKSTYSIHELIRDKTIVYFHLPDDDESPYQAIFKCFINQWWRVAQAEAKSNGGKLPHETLIVGDEWGNLGKVEATGQITTLGRAMKLHLAIFLQNLKQLNCYNRAGDNGAGRDKILGSIGGKIALSLANPEDCSYFTKLVGKRTVRSHSQSEQQNRNGMRSSAGNTFSEQQDDLIHEAEWLQRIATRDGAIVIMGGENATPGREGVYCLPLTYASQTPASKFFGLGSEDYEGEKRRSFYKKMEEQSKDVPTEKSSWCPDFSKYKNESTSENDIETDEFDAWD